MAQSEGFPKRLLGCAHAHKRSAELRVNPPEAIVDKLISWMQAAQDMGSNRNGTLGRIINYRMTS